MGDARRKTLRRCSDERRTARRTGDGTVGDADRRAGWDGTVADWEGGVVVPLDGLIRRGLCDGDASAASLGVRAPPQCTPPPQRRNVLLARQLTSMSHFLFAVLCLPNPSRRNPQSAMIRQQSQIQIQSRHQSACRSRISSILLLSYKEAPCKQRM